MAPTYIALLVLGAFVALLWMAIRHTRKLKTEEQAALRRLGFAPLPALDERVLARIRDFRRLEGKKLHVRNVYEQRHFEMRLLRFDLAGQNQETSGGQVFALIHPALDLPRFSIVPALRLPGFLGTIWDKIYRHALGRTGLETLPVHGCSKFTDKYMLLTGERTQDMRHVQRSTWERLAALPQRLFLDAAGDTILFQVLLIGGAARSHRRMNTEQKLRAHVSVAEQLGQLWLDEFRRRGAGRALPVR